MSLPALISITTMIFFMGCHKKNISKDREKERMVAYVKVVKGVLEGKVSWRGALRPVNRIEIRADRKVKIGKLLVSNFSQVKKGTQLLEVDKTELLQKKVDLQDKMRSSELELHSNRVKLGHNRKIFERKKSLFEKGIVARKEFDDATKDLKLGETDLEAKLLEVEKTKREWADLEAQEQGASFLAPMDGVVSNLPSIDASSSGTELNQGQVAAVVSDPKSLALTVQVEETSLHRASVGKAVSVALDTLPGRKFLGKILEVNKNSNDGQASRIRTYEALIKFDEGKETKLREGFGGEATLVYDRRESAVTVPLSALRYLDGKDFILVASKDGGDAKPKNVQVGLKTETEAEITSGVSSGEFVVMEKN